MLDKFFKISERGSTVSNEVIGGLTTFLAMAYIIAVNPAMMEAAGIPFSLFLTKRSDAGCAERQARVRTDTIGHGERCLTMPYFLTGVVL